MKNNIFLAKSIDGKLNFGSDANESRLKECVKANPNKTFRIEMVSEKRSLSQNAFYHLYLSVIERETGNNADDLHELFKRTLLPPRLITVMGKELKIPATTTTLSKTQMSEFLDRICAETNIPLPDRELAGYFVE